MNRVEGYYQFATISGDVIIFVSEDDLWSVPVTGGVARRITAGGTECLSPRLSPDGQTVAFVAKEEGHPEIYVMDTEGGPARRLTFLGSDLCRVAGWSPDSQRVLFVSDAMSPFTRNSGIFEISASGGMPTPWNIGHAVSVATDGRVTAIGRNNNDPARWKRYRGGTAGELWIDAEGDGTFSPLIQLKGNLASPMIVGSRVYFLSDHEGMGNIYSCKPDGGDLKRHTHQKEYYVRHPSTDGRRIVFTAGGDLFILDTQGKGEAQHVPVRISSAPRQAVRKFVAASDFIEHVAVHPQGHSLGLISRGQPFTMPFWEEAVIQHGAGSRARYRNIEWLPAGDEFIVVNDLSGYERIELHTADQTAEPEFVSDENFGRVVTMIISPIGKKVAIANHRHELVLIDLETKEQKILDRSPADRIGGLSWSADGQWIAYSYSPYPNIFNIRVVASGGGTPVDVTKPLRNDFATSFDPEGKFLYFLGSREFNPIYDAMQFDLSFPYGVKPYAIALRDDVKSPFVREPKALFEVEKPAAEEEAKEEEEESESEDTTACEEAPDQAVGATAEGTESEAEDEDEDAAEDNALQIHFDGIAERIIPFPVDEGRYGQIAGLKGRVLYTELQLQTIKRHESMSDETEDPNILHAFDFAEQRDAILSDGMDEFYMALDNRTVVYESAGKLRAIDGLAALPETPDKPADEIGRKSGWIDVSRAQVMIEPYAEWQQMFEETWRLQREHFWDESMSKVDWDVVHKRYAALLPRINSRTELSDLIWEMQGELGTSHAYEMGGDYRQPSPYQRGFLGAEFEFDDAAKGYRITKIVRGDCWDTEADSPLAKPGLGIKVGDVVIAVGGRKATRDCSLDELLINCAACDVMLTLRTADGATRSVAVRTLSQERDVRYRDWVETNRRYVHEKTDGRIGYLHVPDMGPWGFAEFHRNYLSEIHRDGLIVDVRFNRGGHVSGLLLEKLARKRVGYDVSRWGMPMPYPQESVAGPMVAVTNQFAGSDGDIFSHCFKLYKLGPLVGKRTWGGVIGIWPRHQLVDGTITTQPEFSFWFTDVGWKVENYGTEPDYPIDIAPQDYKHGRDPQLDKSIELINETLRQAPFALPKFDERPNLALPSFS